MKIIEVTEENFDNEVLKSEKPVIIDFNANWCGPCRMLSPILEEVATENDSLKIVSINIDNEDELASKYKVVSIPCLVLIKNGNEEKRSVGLISKEELEQFINN